MSTILNPKDTLEVRIRAQDLIRSTVYCSGPLTFDYAAFNGSVPTFLDNPYSWTQALIKSHLSQYLVVFSWV